MRVISRMFVLNITTCKPRKSTNDNFGNNSMYYIQKLYQHVQEETWKTYFIYHVFFKNNIVQPLSTLSLVKKLDRAIL